MKCILKYTVVRRKRPYYFVIGNKLILIVFGPQNPVVPLPKTGNAGQADHATLGSRPLNQIWYHLLNIGLATSLSPSAESTNKKHSRKNCNVLAEEHAT